MSKVHNICPICAACNTKQKDGYYMCCACRHKWRDVESSSVFDHITASPEVLAEEFVEPYTRWGEDGYPETLWRSNFRELSGMLFDTKEEAITATVGKLKEVEK